MSDDEQETTVRIPWDMPWVRIPAGGVYVHRDTLVRRLLDVADGLVDGAPEAAMALAQVAGRIEETGPA